MGSKVSLTKKWTKKPTAMNKTKERVNWFKSISIAS